MIFKKDETKEQQLTKEQVLSLDIATHCGFYNPLIGFGTIDLTESKFRNDNKQHLHFFNQLTSWVKEYDIKQIVAEDFTVFASGEIISIKKLCELRGVLLLACDMLNLPEPCFINCTEAKKWLTGSGKATKKDMIYMLNRRFGIDTKGDDNAADATTFWLMYCKRFKLI